MLKEVRRKESFPARDEKGLVHQVDVLVEILDMGHMDDPNAEIEGMKRLQTRNGEPLNYRAKGKYEFARTGRMLVSDHPEAV